MEIHSTDLMTTMVYLTMIHSPGHSGTKYTHCNKIITITSYSLRHQQMMEPMGGTQISIVTFLQIHSCIGLACVAVMLMAQT